MTDASSRAAALHVQGHAAVADMRPVQGARLLRAGLRLLDRHPAGDPGVAELRGRILVSLAYAESERGRIDQGWQLLDEAERLLPPHRLGLLLNQRALLYIRTGQDEAAIGQYDRSLTVLSEREEPQDLARALLNRGNLQMTRGRLRQARADLARCAQISEDHGLSRILPMAIHSIGYLDYLGGDLPSALRTYRTVADLYAVVKPGMLPVLALDRARALIAAGLFAEADEQLAFALESFRSRHLQQDQGEAQLARAEAALLAGDAAAARRWATQARQIFLRRGNQRWAASAALVALRARPLTTASAGLRVAEQAADVAATLTDLGLPEDGRQASLVAVRGLLAAGRLTAADDAMAAVRAPRRDDRLDTRLLWWLARAECATARGQTAEASRHAAAGMAALRRSRDRLGCLDLQTGAAVHGRDLAAAGMAAALRSRSLARVYRWSELSRAQALLLPPVTPPADPSAAACLEELRQVRASLREAERAGGPIGDLRVRAARLEGAVREHSWSATGPRAGGPGAGRADSESHAPLASVHAGLGACAMVVYLRDGTRLHALTLVDGRVRLVPLGEYAAAAEAVRRLRADLDATAGRALPAALAAVVAQSTRRDAASVAASVLDPLRRLIGDRALVVIPTGGLAVIPWTALPGCAGRPITVAPSATTWLAARDRLRVHGSSGSSTGPPVLIAGPGIDGGPAEVRAIAGLYPTATVLTGPAATPTATMKALSGASLAHLAAHGHHHSENALFSSLDLTGGSLMGYDLQRLDAPPALVVLACCELGLADVRPGDETLGMTTALLHAGTPTVVASVARLADAAAPQLMTAFHAALRRGRPPAEALAEAMREDTAAGFVCFGAG